MPRTPRTPVRKITLKKPTEHCAQKPEIVKEKIKMIEMKIEKKLPTPKKNPPKMKILTFEKIRKLKMKTREAKIRNLTLKTAQELTLREKLT